MLFPFFFTAIWWQNSTTKGYKKYQKAWAIKDSAAIVWEGHDDYNLIWWWSVGQMHPQISRNSTWKPPNKNLAIIPSHPIHPNGWSRTMEIPSHPKQIQKYNYRISCPTIKEKLLDCLRLKIVGSEPTTCVSIWEIWYVTLYFGHVCA